jgi:hypothetical protein
MSRAAPPELLSSIYARLDRPQWSQFYKAIPYLPMKLRKMFLDVSRIQSDPRKNDEHGCRVPELLSLHIMIPHPITPFVFSVSEALDLIFSDPDVVVFSIMSMAVRSFYTEHDSEIAKILDDGFHKEYHAARGVPLPPCVSWDTIFSTLPPSAEELSSTIHNIHIPPFGVSLIRERMLEWRSKQHLFSRMGRAPTADCTQAIFQILHSSQRYQPSIFRLVHRPFYSQENANLKKRDFRHHR